MRIIPVLDIMDGQVVHGVGGVRSRYRPIISKVTKSSDPLQVAADLKESFGFREVYVADLDAIQGRGSNLEKVEGIMGLGYSVYLDAGLGGAGDMTPRLAGVHHVVIGTETLQSLRELRVACMLHGSVVASLDFKGDELLARDRSLKGIGARELVEAVSGAGISEIIYLDLVRVGMASGGSTGHHAEKTRCRPMPSLSQASASSSWSFTNGWLIITVVLVTMPRRCASRMPRDTPGERP